MGGGKTPFPFLDSVFGDGGRSPTQLKYTDNCLPLGQRITFQALTLS